MNDRFKFRIYDLEQKHYLRVIQDEITGAEGFAAFYGKYNNICKPMSFFLCHDIDRWVIEQCTGLKDKNGNLIYEDDILEISMIIKPSDKHKAKVYYNEKKAVWQLYHWDTDKTTLLSDYLDSQIEIIGNVHEQPEQKDK